MGSRYRKPWFELEASWRMGTLHGAKGQVKHGEWGPQGLTAKLAFTLPIGTSYRG